jgi:hypothetical protein
VPFPTNVTPVSPAFTSGAVCPSRPGAVIDVEPSYGETTLFWQIEANFCFSTPTGSGLVRPRISPPNTWGVLTAGGLAAGRDRPMPRLTVGLRARAEEEIVRSHITAVVVGPESHPFASTMQTRLTAWLTALLGTAPRRVDDILLWSDPRVLGAVPA